VINVGILGAGNIARTHVRAYGQIANARIVAVDDIVAEKAEAMAGSLGVRAYTEWAAFLAHPGLDMVDVCLPTYLHEQGVIAAAAAGKHVLCEKPITLELEQADRMIAAVNKAGVKAMIAQVIRFWPRYLMVKDLLERGALGAPVMTHAARLGTLPQWGSWFTDPALSGGAIMDLHIHDLDWLYYLYGRPKSVYSVGVQAANGAWNQALSSLDYGAHKAAVEASLLMPDSFPFTMIFRLLGTAGYAEYRYGGGQTDPQGQARLHTLGLYQPGQPPQFPDCVDADPYLAEIRYFVDRLDAGLAPEIATLEEARAVLEIALAVRQSLQTGKVIPMTQAER
jgi:predicted dehydrogenase